MDIITQCPLFELITAVVLLRKGWMEMNSLLIFLAFLPDFLDRLTFESGTKSA